jgi:hypothetical protein
MSHWVVNQVKIASSQSSNRLQWEIPFRTHPLNGLPVAAMKTPTNERLFARRKRASAATKSVSYQPLEPRQLLAGLPIITEFLASNSNGSVDDNGNRSDWIEIYNAGDAPINLQGYSLTDDADDPDRWTFPSTSLAVGQFLVLRAATDADPTSGADLYTGFGLSSSGEYVGLFDPAGNVVSEFGSGGSDYPTQYSDVSYGVQFDGNFDQVSYFGTPTFGAPNADPFAGFTGRVFASVDAGFYEDTFQVSLSTNTASQFSFIAYTTDGSTPTLNNSTLYSSPITISSTTNLRAASFSPNFRSAPDRTWSYIFVDDVLTQSNNGQTPANFPAVGSIGRALDYGIDPAVIATEGASAVRDALLSIPTWSITTDIENLFDEDTGIYANPLQDGVDWERAASVELLNPDGSEGFQVNAGLRIRGGFSRLESNPKHSFRLFFRSEYGDSELEYPVHGNTGVDTFDRLDLRTAQNYSWSKDGDGSNNFITDQFNRENQLALGQPSTRSSWLHLYLNGQYWGLYQTQERVDNNFAADYLGGDPEDYDVIKPDAGPGRPYINAATEGDLTAYNRLYQQALARAPDGTTPAFVDNAAYYEAQGLNPDGTANANYETLLDVDNLIDYMILVFHSGNFDAPITRFINDAVLNNYNAIRSRTGDHGFQFFIHDAEHSYRTNEVNIDRTGPFNHENFESGVEFFNPQWLHQQLMANNEYRITFADRIQEVFFNDGVLSDDNLVARWDSLSDQIDQAIIAESARWGDAQRNNPLLRSNWVNAVAGVRNNILRQRTEAFLNQMRNTELRLRNSPNDSSFNRTVDAPLLPNVEAPDFLIDGVPQHGGLIDGGQELQFGSSGSGTIFYTTDGTDPREVGGGLSSSAQFYDGSVSTSTLFDAGSIWQYEDSGQDLGTGWREPGFNDNSWASGNGRFGFGDPASTTTVNSGPDGNRNRTTYFRKEFTSTGNYDTATLSINRDDGVVVYLNGEEIIRDNLPAGEITYNTFALEAIGGNAESQFVDFSIPASMLIAGVNTIAVEVHQVNATSSDLGFDAELTVGQIASSGVLPLTSTTSILSRTVAADGTWSPLQSAQFVVAGSAAPVSDLRISEINYNPHDPSGAETAAGVTDNDDFEFLELYNSSATGTISLSGLQFVNGITFTFGNDSLAPGERAVIVRDITGFQVRYGTDARVLGQYGGSLRNSGETLELADSNLNAVISVEYGDTDPWSELADGSGASLVLIDPVNTPENELSKYYSWRSSVEQGGSPGTEGLGRSGVVINEVLANPDLDQVDAIELFNPTATAINIGGWYLGDDAANPFQFVIPGGTILNPGQYVVFDETDFNPTPANPQFNHFGLSGSAGDEVYLSRIAFPGFLAFEDEVTFGASFNGESFGRDPNGSGRLTRLSADTLGAVNGNSIVGPLVISEVNYHPGEPSSTALAIDPTLIDNDLEFIEIHNPTSASVDTTNWRIRGEVDFDFPAESIAAGGTWVLVSFDPSISTNKLNAFRAHYGIGTNINVIGPFSDDGSFLSNSSGRISLQQPDDPVALEIPHVTVDEVVYDDLSPWADADGSDDSLNRISGIVNGNFASNWNAATPTPGVANLVTASAPQVVSFVRDGGSVARPDLWSTIDVQFSAGVDLTASSLVIRNDSVGGALVDLSGIGFSHIAGASSATWDLSSLNTPLDAAFYSVTLESNSIAGTVGGLSLDGNGSGSAGGDFATQIYQAIPGDANLDGQVNVLGDGFALVANLGTTTGVGWSGGDFNADGTVNVLGDGFVLVANLGQDVVPPASAASQFAASSKLSSQADSVSQSFSASMSTQSFVLSQADLLQGDSEESNKKRAVTLASVDTPVLAGSQQLDDTFASEDWLI